MTVSALELVVLCLAAYRLARAVSLDSITEPARDWLAVHAPVKLAELVSCGFCSGFWLSGIVATVWLAAAEGGLQETGIVEWQVLWWAVAGGAALLTALDSYWLREAPS